MCNGECRVSTCLDCPEFKDQENKVCMECGCDIKPEDDMYCDSCFAIIQDPSNDNDHLHILDSMVEDSDSIDDSNDYSDDSDLENRPY